MIYLCEREIGFDPTAVGFPSINGCRAVVLVTGGGLFGFHLNGSLSAGKRTAFSQFVSNHINGAPKNNLYAACTQPGSDIDHAELRQIASDVGYSGTIYWAGLASVAAGSAYVEMEQIHNNTCVIQARTWNDSVDGVPGNKGPYLPANRAMANGAPNAQMYTNVSTAGLRTVYPSSI